MRAVVALLLLAFGLTPVQAFDTPRALLEAVYASYGEGKVPMPVENYYSVRLKEIEARHLERQAITPQGEKVDPSAPGTGNFDPMISGETPVLLDLSIGEPVVSAERAVAIVSFRTFGRANQLAVALVLEADGWKVDDVASLGGEEHWLLSWLLQYDPFGMN